MKQKSNKTCSKTENLTLLPLAIVLKSNKFRKIIVDLKFLSDSNDWHESLKRIDLHVEDLGNSAQIEG